LLRCLCLTVLLMLSACTTYSVRAPIGDRTQSPLRTPDTHQVRRGDTLYSIAFLYGVSIEELADWNELHPPYTIYRGQELRLRPAAAQPPAPVVQAAMPRASQPKPRTGTPSRPQSPSATAPVMRPAAPAGGTAALVGSVPKIAAPSVPKSAPAARATPPRAAGQSRPAAPPAAAPAASTGTARQAVAVPARAESNQQVFWSWPAEGRVIRGYDPDRAVKKGIDIGGSGGDAVRAAAAGKVVYAGSGLSGYGRLIIIKHNNDFLSAYAHNRKLIAREGQWVNKGEVIAQMGSSGTDRTQLHFEIRKHGRPVDPLRYLPSR
jgi:lipoprotein NlpD